MLRKIKIQCFQRQIYHHQMITFLHHTKSASLDLANYQVIYRSYVNLNDFNIIFFGLNNKLDNGQKSF